MASKCTWDQFWSSNSLGVVATEEGQAEVEDAEAEAQGLAGLVSHLGERAEVDSAAAAGDQPGANAQGDVVDDCEGMHGKGRAAEGVSERLELLRAGWRGGI